MIVLAGVLSALIPFDLVFPNRCNARRRENEVKRPKSWMNRWSARVNCRRVMRSRSQKAGLVLTMPSSSGHSSRITRLKNMADLRNEDFNLVLY
ncbi:hypothetical protein B0T20DRAFT_111007 [Sordaria brevicollis]|uniref:Secreted protein n=1 Tax=Sordaria brevicollis TaxID=83679 RepID=A0AAE0U0R3_SORBR|nr:hypothetical protein B0T20DRAFT_111007 [Sordaria brevicollis]